MNRTPLWDQALRDARRMSAAGRRTECRAYSCIWDGFDNTEYSETQWDASSGNCPYSSAYQRFPAASGCVSQGLKCVNGNYLQKNVTGNQPTMIVGLAFNFPTLPPSGNTQGFLAFVDSHGYQCNVGVNSAGALVVRQGSSGSVLGQTANGLITGAAWYWLDVEVTIGAAGSISLYLNEPAGGPAILALTSVNTQGSTTGYISGIQLGDINFVTGNAMYFDDFHAHDNTGAAPNSIMGESRIYTKMPSGAGGATNWTPNGASANWQCVDEVPPDDDTTYVSSNTPGAIDAYAVGVIGLTAAPHGVVARMYARRDDAGPHTAQVGVRSSSTNGFGSAASINSTYGWVDAFFADDPNTSALWTAAGADAAQIAIDETS